ncbi:dTMP kinase [Candidatus Legionella polyplacis]|uniref:Thymidylate kinase n=1 Tax=Candidatus Legionella polyplacis TaxID=2005262 RepID=A0ABZ2H1H9_9GAMM
MKNNCGYFIVIEGLEGSGKSTILRLIKKYLILKNFIFRILTVRDPGGTFLGESIRKIITNKNINFLSFKAELLLFYAARVQLFEQVIQPALKKNICVLSDRFELSTFAYQYGGRKINKEFIIKLSDFCLNKFKPDLTFFLDISPRECFNRILKRNKIDRFEKESFHFFQCVYDTYHEFINSIKDIICINVYKKSLSEILNVIILKLNNLIFNDKSK